ncbi:helix-turn-helix transcriptional regulator [Actinomadura harenae]|uniref:LuxR family transcriptional regulator n=1 Tax=Actinomadura harenae TaxID=2483351 RepID=A0A3M2LQB2_9ACTN|nr:LuxR family transcriptional regulator [Actinomadura harenae]RMI39512.1 LuxR family transcriptional regulator [Actinomadura harenae]
MSADGRSVVGRVVSPLLVGRDEEMARLVGAVARAPAVVVVTGEAGIGKTRLVAEMAGRPELRGRRVLTGTCRRIREPFPLGPIVEALRDTAAALGEEGAGALSRVAGALRPLLPELEDVLPPAPQPLGDRLAERHRIFRGLAQVFAALGPTVLVVEDAHWADEQTLEFLDYLLAGPPPALSVVVTYRGEDAGPDVRLVTARPAAEVTRERIELAPLDVARTRELTQAILDADRITDELAAYLCERASGVPLAVQELLALLRQRGTLAWRRGRWARRTVAELDVPVRVRDSVLERVARLSDGARAVAEAAAVLMTAVPQAVLLDAARGGTADGLDEAVESGLIGERGGDFGFRHVLAAQAVSEEIPTARRRDLHGRAADAVRHLDRVPLGVLAHHLRESGRVAEWVDVAVRAAERATELRDDAEAFRLLDGVLRDADLEPVRRAELTVLLAKAAFETLRVPDLRTVFARALAADLPRRLRAELRLRLGLYLDSVGLDPDEKWVSVRESVEHLDQRAGLAAWGMLALGMPTEPTGLPVAERRGWVDRAIATLPNIEEPAQRQFVLGKASMARLLTGDPRWTDLRDRIRGGPAEIDSRRANAFYSLGIGAGFAGHHEVARDSLRTALEIGTEMDPTGGIAYRSRAGLLLVSYLRGEWDGLADAVPEVLDGLRDRTESMFAEAVAVCLDVAADNPPGIVDRLRAVAEVAVPGDAMLLAVIVDAWLRPAVAGGAAAEALADTAAYVDLWETRGMWAAGVRAVPSLVEALIADGRTDDARALTERYTDRLAGLDAPMAQCALTYARGLLAAADGGGSRAGAAYAAAAEGYERLPAPYEAARAREHAAGALRGVDAPAASAFLARAATAFERLGATRDLDRVARTARRRGIELAPRPAPRRGPRGYGGALSPREREVAELAASGLTNRDIASRLYVSPKTVEKHLASALRKLGLRTRAGLAARLAEGPGAATG